MSEPAQTADSNLTRTTRVLILQRILPPYRLAFFQHLARSPHLEVTLAYGSASPKTALESVIDPSGICTVRLHNLYLGQDEKIICQKSITALIASGQYDVVIAEFNPRILTNIVACLKARRCGLPFVWWGHGFRPKSSALYQRLYLRLAEWAQALIFYTADGATGFIERGVNKEKTFVAWNSIDMEEIGLLTDRTEQSGRRRIICIGRLIAEKKVDLLIRGFALAAPRLDAVATLTIIGEGPERENLLSLTERLKIMERVEFVGSMYEQSKLAPLFNSATVSVSPGYIGLSAIHSLAYGVPMVVADKEPHSPEIAAIHEDVNAIFFRANDPEDLAEKLILLLGDPRRLSQMSAAAIEGVHRQFSLGAMVKAFEEAIRFAMLSVPDCKAAVTLPEQTF